MARKRRAKGRGLMIAGVVGGIVLLVALISGGFFMVAQQAIPGITEAEVSVAISEEFCSNNPNVDLSVKQLDALTATATPVNASYYLVDITDPEATSVDEVTIPTDSLSFSASSDALLCGHEYDIYVKTSQDDDVGTLVAELDSSDTMQDPVKLTFSIPQNDEVRLRVYDLTEGAYMYDDSDNSNTDYEEASSALNFTSSTNNETAKTVGADEDVEFRVEVKTENADKQFGAETYIAFDYIDDSNANDWQEPTVTYSGQTLDNVKGTLSSNDQLGLNAYEAVYKLPTAVDESTSKVEVLFMTGSGVNPNMDIAGKFLGTGVYVDDENPNELLVGSLFRTDSARTEMVTATSQEFSLAIE